jgi:hypothetical protein
MRITAARAAKYVKDGVEWEIAFFDFVDCFRRETDKISLIQDTPNSTGDEKLDSLLKSMVLYLCDESEMEPPEWSEEDGWLKIPWFVCGLSRLYSFCLVETPIRFKQNNIFVLANFMERV